MTGIIVGVCIALACIVMCALILISKGRPRYSTGSFGIRKITCIISPLTSSAVLFSHRKSSSHKVVAVGAAEVHRTGLALPSERLTENAEALIPMIHADFIDSKVKYPETLIHVYVFYAQKSTKQMSLMCFRGDLT